MIRRILLVTGLLSAVLLSTGAAPPRTASPATALSMTLYLAGGSKPMSGVAVTVFYFPFDPPARKFTPQVMAKATTDAAGRFTAGLDTSMVPKTGLADVGTGPGAFNAVVVAVTASGQTVFANRVLQVGRAITSSASAVTNPDTGAAELAARVPRPSGGPPDWAIPIASHYRYIPVLALNNAGGMSAAFHYTFDRSTAKQTMAGAAVSVNGPPALSWGAFSVSGSTTESTDREFDRHMYVGGAYHKFIWANYKWVEYWWETCTAVHAPCTQYHEWALDHWQGSFGQYNPNQQCVRFGHRHGHRICVKRKTIKVVGYTPPRFTYCSGNCTTELTRSRPDVTRSTVNTHVYAFQLDAAGFLWLGTQAAYGSITSVTWTWRKHGCTGGRLRVLWGHDSDPATTPVLQAVCRKLP